MKYTRNSESLKGFALPTVMIASVVMLMVLLSGLVASSSVNVSLREQTNQKQLSLTVDAGIAAAQACMQKSNYDVTWTDDLPLRPNTDCYGHELVSCPDSSTDDRCYLLNSAQTRTSYEVGATRNNNMSFVVKAISQSLRTSSGTVASQQSTAIRGRQIERLNTNVSTGGSATCAVSSVMRVYCWGINGYGALGSGQAGPSTNPNPLPVEQGAVPANTDMQSVAMGFTHSCALTVRGKAYCWGTGTSGQLGNNNGNASSNVPVAVAQGEMPVGVGFTALTNGYYHTCGIATDKKVYCWGLNTYGQLGIGGAAGGTFSYPRAVALPAGVYATSISAAYQHNCAVGSDTKVYCWGRNDEGQLGNNSITQSATPVKVITNTSGAELTATAIGAAYYHSCAVGTDGNPYCWGQNSAHQLGKGNTTPSLIAARTSQGQIPTNVRLTHISSYYQHTCAIGSNGRVYCWGGPNAYAQFGKGTTGQSAEYAPELASAVVNAPGDTITGISVGDYHTCINASNTKIYCWGYNVHGQNGNGTTTSPSGVTEVTGSNTSLGYSTNMRISATDSSTCTVGTDAKAYCWGDNTNFGQLGNGTLTSSSSPTPIAQGAIPSGVTIRDIEIGSSHACVIASNDQIYCWGNNNNGQLGNGTTYNHSATPVAVLQGAIPSGVTIRSITVKALHTCALGSDGKAYCWGRNDYGQVGNGSTAAQFTSPVAVEQGAIPIGVTLRSLVSGQSQTCAVGTDAKAYCWGRNDLGSLGNGTGAHSYVPVAVSQGAIPAGVTIRSLVKNGLHVCALASNSKAYCWGYNSQGQLGNNTLGVNSSTPVAVSQGAIPASVGIQSLSAGSQHICALASDTKIYCWGNSYGNGTTTRSLIPVYATAQNALPAGVTIRNLTSGNGYNCMLGSNAQSYCWGYNSYGQNGNGATSGTASTTLNNVVQSQRWLKGVPSYSLIVRY